ncbi:MAG: hypothetical protein H8E55_30200 [Pelagibacterales bacterium]|nr:hypothetical protein [Pelagibacterales bacterium]
MKNFILFTLLFCLTPGFVFSQNAAEILMNKGDGLVIGGYGEIHLNVNEDANNKVDVHRLVTLLGYNFNDKVRFVSEIEFEHVKEVYVEQAFLSYSITDNLNLRAGLMLIPMGIVNEYHEPTTFNGVERPGMDKSIIPSTWREIGFGLNGRMDNASLKYQLYLFNGFKSDGLGGSNGIRSGRQKGAEAMWNTTNVSFDLDWYGVNGLKLGFSGYFGDSNVDEGVDVPGVGISMIGLDARYTKERFGMRGQYITTSIDGSEEYNTAWESDLGSKMNGWYIETSYNLMGSDKTERLDLFARYSNYNTHAGVAGSLTRNDEYNRNVLTTGLSWHVAKGAAFKMDYQILGNEGPDDNTSAINFGMGFWF